MVAITLLTAPLSLSWLSTVPFITYRTSSISGVITPVGPPALDATFGCAAQLSTPSEGTVGDILWFAYSGVPLGYVQPSAGHR